MCVPDPAQPGLDRPDDRAVAAECFKIDRKAVDRTQVIAAELVARAQLGSDPPGPLFEYPGLSGTSAPVVATHSR